jgi:hypothetical protein
MEEPTKYPIDDLLVQPCADDPVFTNRPSPSRDFNIPMDCLGELIMVWDFCSSFGRLLHLWPFCLEDFENAICHKDSSLILLVESHSALLRLLIKDDGEYLSSVQKRNRKLKVNIPFILSSMFSFLFCFVLLGGGGVEGSMCSSTDIDDNNPCVIAVTSLLFVMLLDMS